MTLERLNQYISLRREAEMWEREIAELKLQAEKAADTVRASREAFPFTPYTAKISGVQASPDKRLALREKRLQRRRAEAREQQALVRLELLKNPAAQRTSFFFRRALRDAGPAAGRAFRAFPNGRGGRRPAERGKISLDRFKNPGYSEKL